MNVFGNKNYWIFEHSNGTTFIHTLVFTHNPSLSISMLLSFVCLCVCIVHRAGSYMLMHMWRQRERKINSTSADAVKEVESKDTKTKQE